ncbi:agmatine deiminase family protein [Prevotella denticola]|uniref:agmatine deiminase family protein n=1 Tax=Prevotella denticola TaxID=28129 RepID=UPI001BAE1623|nr:agmatine deiminase family protein [Prevotella denticola]QUB90037.1 agmatine deiminase family protein [Prevotella denticola]
MNTNRHHSFRLPAEWEPQSSVMLIWPHEDTDWRPYLKEITEVYLQMADAITRHEAMLITARNTEQVRTLLAERLTERQMRRVTLFACDSNDTWARDVAPISLVSDVQPKDSFQPIHLLDFYFNGWGGKFAAEKDNGINRQVYEAGLFHGTLENHKDFVLEGGSIESDGDRTLFTTTSCLTAAHRNQPLTKEDIDRRLRLLFPNVERVVWLDHGQLAGDDTDGHIDTIVRIAPDDTLLYIGCDDKEDEHYEDFHLLEEQLKQLRTLDGNPYRMLQLPMTDAVYDDGERLPATYANFFVINGAVLVPTYHQPVKDKTALETIQEAFPGREIIGIDSRTIIRQHGSIHCLTMQLP